MESSDGRGELFAFTPPVAAALVFIFFFFLFFSIFFFCFRRVVAAGLSCLPGRPLAPSGAASGPTRRLRGSHGTVGAAGAVGAGLSRVVSSESDPGTARDRVAGGSEEATPCLPERRLTYERTAAEGPDGMMFGWRAGRAPEASMDIPSRVKYETTEVLC